MKRTLVAISVGLALVALSGCGREKAEPRQEISLEDTAGMQPTGRKHLAPPETTAVSRHPDAQPENRTDLPRLVDLGKNTCIPCKKMAPILDELKKEYAGKAVIEVVDLRDDPQAAGKYGIRLIPTQIFLDGQGNEVWRHEGFLSKDAIIAKFEDMGVESLDN